jgi:hypothetical protein
LALVPENRKFDGLFFNFRASGNITAASLGGSVAFRRAEPRKPRKRPPRTLFVRLRSRPQAEEKTVNFLSGGNQQKIVIARWLFSDAQVLILDEPTQGIDIGAKIAVYKLINKLTRAGKSIILISSDHDELLGDERPHRVVQHGAIKRTVDAAILSITIWCGRRPTPSTIRSEEASHERIFDTQLIGPFAAMVIVALIVALTTDRFLNPGNLSNLSLQVSIVALIAIGSTIVIFAAGIDLSSGSMVALLTMILAQMLKFMGICRLRWRFRLILVTGGCLAC